MKCEAVSISPPRLSGISVGGRDGESEYWLRHQPGVIAREAHEAALSLGQPLNAPLSSAEQALPYSILKQAGSWISADSLYKIS